MEKKSKRPDLKRVSTNAAVSFIVVVASLCTYEKFIAPILKAASKNIEKQPKPQKG